MEVQVLLCLLLLHSTLKANAICQRGQLRMVGTVDMNYVTGRMELCDNDGVWRKICGHGWGRDDAKVACRQMGFSDQATRVHVSFCGNSCYGTSSLNKRFHSFDCSGNEQNLIDCSPKIGNNGDCPNAGVTCVKVSETVTETFPDFMTTTNVITHKGKMVTTVTERGQCTQVVPSVTLQTSCTVTPPSMQTAGWKGHPQANCAALSGGLGGLAALMALGMVGVALGLAWSCHRTTIQEKTVDHENPTYSTTSMTQPRPLVQYSSTGPQDNPTHGTLEGVSSTYDIIKNDPPPTEGDHDYQVLEEKEGGVYGVPVNTGGNITSIEEDYSTLQHQ